MPSVLRNALIIVLFVLIIFCLAKFVDNAAVPKQPLPARYRTLPRYRAMLRIFHTELIRREFLRHLLNANRFNDAQNVHDPAVVQSIGRKYRRLVELQPDVTQDLIPTLFDIAEAETNEVALRHYGDADPRPGKIAATITYMRNAAATIVSLQNNEPIREIEVFVRVQLRIADCILPSPDVGSPTAAPEDAGMPRAADESGAENVPCAEDAQGTNTVTCAAPAKISPAYEILLKQLLDMEEGTGYVCATGRVSRLINTFTAVDPDPQLAEVELSESQLQTAILNRAQAVVQETLEADEEMQQVYNGEDELPPGMADRLKTKIAETLRAEYAERIDPITLNKLVGEAQAAIS